MINQDYWEKSAIDPFRVVYIKRNNQAFQYCSNSFKFNITRRKFRKILAFSSKLSWLSDGTAQLKGPFKLASVMQNHLQVVEDSSWSPWRHDFGKLPWLQFPKGKKAWWMANAYSVALGGSQKGLNPSQPDNLIQKNMCQKTTQQKYSCHLQ